MSHHDLEAQQLIFSKQAGQYALQEVHKRRETQLKDCLQGLLKLQESVVDSRLQNLVRASFALLIFFKFMPMPSSQFASLNAFLDSIQMPCLTLALEVSMWQMVLFKHTLL